MLNPLLRQARSLEAMLVDMAADIIQPRPEQTEGATARAENSLYEFARQAWPVLEPARGFVDGWHIGCIAEHLQAVEALEIRNLIVNIPPRHGKSLLSGVCFFCWTWIRQPSSQWIYCSYGERLAERDSNKCRDLVQSAWYQARWGHIFRLKRAQNAAERFANDRQGYRIATTIAGKAMGEGADFLCLPPDEVVWTERGPLPIGEIVRKYLPVRAWSVEPETGRCNLKPITAWYENPGSPIVEVVLSDGARFRCTPDHKVWTANRGWVRADGLRTSDVLPGEAVPDLVHGAATDAESDTHGARNGVQPLESGYRSPLFVRHVGYSETTYCVTVADYHTLLAGNGKVLVRNCFDDPHKPTEVRSEAHRLQVLESWQKTMSTRGNDPKTVRKLLIMQRLHERDLTGYLVAERGGYEHLVLPAEYEPRRYWFLGARGDDGNGARGEFRKDAEKQKPRNAIVPTTLQRRRPELLDGPEGSGRKEEGDLLWPAQFGPAEIAGLKADLEGSGWAGQGQQRPAPEEGLLFRQDFFRRFTVNTGQSGLEICLYQGEDRDPLLLPAWRLRFFQVADTALSARSTSSYTVCVTFAFDRLTRFLLVWDVFRQRLMVHEQLPALLELRQGKGLWDVKARSWLLPGALMPWPNPVAFQAVEAKASGQGLIDEALSLGKPIRGLNPGSQDKVQRAALAVTLYGQGKVWHRAEAPWLADLEDELLSFPTGARDDQCDCISYGCRLASEDAILNADIDGPLMMPEPRNPDGSPMTVEDLRASEANVDIVRVGNCEVEFPEYEDPFR